MRSIPNGVNNHSLDLPDTTERRYTSTEILAMGCRISTLAFSDNTLAWQRLALVVSWTGEVELRFRSVEVFLVLRIPGAAVADRGVQCFQPRAVFRTRGRECRCRQRALRPDNQGRSTPADAGGAQVYLLRGTSRAKLASPFI